MTKDELTALLAKFQQRKVSADQVIERISAGISEPLGFATVDHHRELRQGFPEVILCEGKTPIQVALIAKKIVGHGSVLLATRANKSHYAAVRHTIRTAKFDALSRTITANTRLVRNRGKGTILVVTAGTSDIPVAEEAAVTAGALGSSVKTAFDVGVAGIHRLFSKQELLDEARVIVVVAGMDGALPSVVGGLVGKPVIAVPTSVGYGAGFRGLAPLLTMLNACAAGIAVMNIDNGFGAGVLAHRINLLGE